MASQTCHGNSYSVDDGRWRISQNIKRKCANYELPCKNKPAKQNRDCQIAAENNHNNFTPPYHPDLQPIETIWAVAKNAMAREILENLEGQKSAVKKALEVDVQTQTSSRKVLQREDL